MVLGASLCQAFYVKCVFHSSFCVVFVIPFPSRGSKGPAWQSDMPEATQLVGSGILIRASWAPGRGPSGQASQEDGGEFQAQASCPLIQGGCGWGGNSHQKRGARGKQGCQEMNPTQSPSSRPALCPWPAAGRLPFPAQRSLQGNRAVPGGGGWPCVGEGPGVSLRPGGTCQT